MGGRTLSEIGDIAAGRLDAAQLAANFADAHPPLSPAQAVVEANRCYFCYDAPCIEACPTGIDIPSFIRKIATGNLRGSAQTILEANILGGSCARVCPTEELCERACVHTAQEAQADPDRRVAAPCHRLADGARIMRAPFTPRRADRAADRGGRRRTGRACLRARAGAAWPRRHDFRSAAEARRAERIRHRRLQGRRRFRAARGRLHSGDRRHQHRVRQGARPRHHAGCAAARFRCGVPGARPGRRARLWACGRNHAGRARRHRLHCRIAPGAEGSGGGRPARRGDRRRQHRDRRGNAGAAAGGGGRDDRLSPRPRADDRDRTRNRHWAQTNNVRIRHWAAPIRLLGAGQ